MLKDGLRIFWPGVPACGRRAGRWGLAFTLTVIARRACRASAGAGRLRPAGRRLFQRAAALWRPGGLRSAVRARPALPRLGLLLSCDRRRQRGMLAEIAGDRALATNCCVSGVRGAGVIEPQSGPIEFAIDRPGGDYRRFDVPPDPTGVAARSPARPKRVVGPGRTCAPATPAARTPPVT